jgi:hypothetical protein
MDDMNAAEKNAEEVEHITTESDIGMLYEMQTASCKTLCLETLKGPD